MAHASTEMADLLDDLLAVELTAEHQYFVQARLLRYWGYEKLAAKQEEESAEERGHAGLILDRLLFLGGTPTAKRLDVQPEDTVPAQLETDLEFEKSVRKLYRTAIEKCLKLEDHGTRVILEEILKDTDGHILWLETQLRLIKETGLQNFLSDWR